MICAVIPTCDSEADLPGLLLQLRTSDMQIVVSDRGSDDKTLKIAARHKAVIAIGRAGRGHQLRRGARRGVDCEWLLFLHADSQLPGHWETLVTRHIKDHHSKAGYFDLSYDSPKFAARLVEILVKLRCAVFALPYGDQGLLISRALYEEVGGYGAVPLFEDVAIIRAIGRNRLRRLGGALITSADKYESDGFFRRGWRNLGLLRRYLKGESPDTLAKDYL